MRFDKFVDSIYDKINEIRPKRANKSPKSKTHAEQRAQTRSKTKQSVDADNAADVIQKLTEILGDDDWDQELVYGLKTDPREFLSWETNNNKYLDKFKGCRKSKNITGATVSRTKGLNALFNCAGIMIKLSEEIVRETPTAVTLELAHCLTNNQTSIDYANRIEAIGYDMMCRIYHHLETLIANERLSPLYHALWSDLIWRAFIDIWHIFNHTDKLCKEDGIFHPTLAKFEEIIYKMEDMMTRVNDQIVEQFWSTMNASGQLKSMNKEHFLLFLLDKRSYYNKAKIEQIKKEGWTFVPLEYFTKLRDVTSETFQENAKFPTQSQLQQKKDIHLKRVAVKPDKIQLVIDLIEENAQNQITQHTT